MSTPLHTLILAGCGWLALLGFARAQGDPEGSLARDLTIGQRPIYEFVQQQQTAQAQRPVQQRVAVEAWTDRADNTFRIGEPVTLSVRPQRDAEITVINVGTSGKATVLFPNRLQRNGRVRGGQVLTLGGPGAGYSIVPQGPAGVELVHVIASTRPLTLPELNEMANHSGTSTFLSLGRSAQEVTRDLSIQMDVSKVDSVVGPNGAATLLIRVQGAAPAAGAQGANLLAALQQLGIPAAAAPSTSAPSTGAVPSTIPATLPNGFAPPPIVIRTDRSVYQQSDAVQIAVAALADCRLTLLSVGPTGNVGQLFPNVAQTDQRLRAGQVIMVPPPGSGVIIHPRGAGGMETILGVCATEPTDAAAATPEVLAQRDLAAVADAITAPGPAASPISTAATVYFVKR